MSLRRLSPDDFESFTVELHPNVRFSSSSRSGATGSVYVYPRRSPSEKNGQPVGTFDDAKFVDSSFFSELSDIQMLSTVGAGTTDIQSAMEKYLSGVNAQPVSSRKQQALEMSRFTPGVRLGSASLRKNVVRKVLFPHYRPTAPSAHWNFTNYHTLNFYTASSVPSDSALLYPNSASNALPTLASGTYSLTGAFSFDFYVNPRYTTDGPHGHFKAGTIFHLSSSYAVSLVSGTHKDPDGFIAGFGIQVQFSHSADIPPSLAVPGNFPHDLVFRSEPNALLRNRWQHVSVRWGTSEIDAGSGSIYVDGIKRGSFPIPSSTIAPARSTPNPDVLVIGNYFEGSVPAGNAPAQFFAADPATRDGLVQLWPTIGVDNPPRYSLAHPLNAEVHELKIYRRFLSDREVLALTGSGPQSLDDLAFYVPPFFTRESPTRRAVSDRGGVMQTPFFTLDGPTDDPFNVAMSFGVAGHDVNLENFTRDFATGHYPRLLNLTGSDINTTTQLQSANEYLYSTGTVRKRNTTLLPCDNGRFKPNFQLLISGAKDEAPKHGHPMDHFVSDTGALDLSVVTLNDMILTSSLFGGLNSETAGNILSGVVGPTPEDPGVSPGSVLTVFQRTRDNSSNDVAFFNVSNLYYGNQIQAETFELIDPALSGTDGKVRVTLRDDGHGNLYRADADGLHAKWASVGTLLYQEGIAVVKDPVLPFFGKDAFTIGLKGTQNAHVMKIHAVAQAGQCNSSSNPNFVNVSASLSANDTDREFVYVGSVQYHDDNLNVVMRTNLAQPVVKRHGQSIKFLTRMTF